MPGSAVKVVVVAVCFLGTVCVTFFIDTDVKDDQTGFRFLL